MRSTKDEITAMRRRLDALIDQGFDLDELYDISARLDKLIIAYYKDRENKNGS